MCGVWMGGGYQQAFVYFGLGLFGFNSPPFFFRSSWQFQKSLPLSIPFLSSLHSSWNQGPEAEHEHQLAGEAG